MSSHERSWVLMSTYGHSWTMRSMLPWCHECSQILSSTNRSTAPCSWVLRIAHDCLWALKSVHEQSLVLMCVHGAMALCSLLMHVHGCTHKHSWEPIKQPSALMSMGPWCNENSWAPMNIYEHEAMAQWAIISSHVITAPYPIVLMSAHKCPGMFMGAYGCS